MDKLTSNKNENYKYFIIGGTIKSATTSLFNYISAHPQVCGSNIKETFFFTQGFSGNRDADLNKYTSYFSPRDQAKILFEASPNYLAYKVNIAPRIKQLLPDAKLMFVLRNPVDRLYSHFNFAKGKLELPKELTFEQFVDLCESFNAGTISPVDAGIPEKHLRALEIGNYAEYLQNFYDVFSAANIKVIFFDNLKREPKKILAEICEYIDVDPAFYEKYKLSRANVTFSAKRKSLHYFMLRINRMLESLLRQRPALKQRLVKIYKFFNQEQQGYDPMRDYTRAKLVRYYAASNSKVESILQGQELPSWIFTK